MGAVSIGVEVQRNTDGDTPSSLMWSDGILSFFDTANLTDLGSKTGYRTLTSLKMFSNLLIHHTGS